MKKFFALFSLALAAILLSALFSVGGVTAATERVIYISDDGTGDGSAPSSPLKAETLVERYIWTDSAVQNGYASRRSYTAEQCNTYWFSPGSSTDVFREGTQYYKNSVLYQAAVMLEDTGGKIVLVGDVTLDYSKSYSYASLTARDFYMPDCSKNVTITSQNGAKLIITEGAHLRLGGDTVFENITIATTSTANSTPGGVQNRAICANGHKVVFGDGIVTTNLQGNSGAYYPSIAGGSRFAATSSSYNTDVTINSGKWYRVYGVTTGIPNNPDYAPSANVKMTINGGEFLNMISCASVNNVYDQVMDVDLTINGGTFSSASTIYASGPRGCLYPDNVTNIKITGGTFNGSTVKAFLPPASTSKIMVDFLPTVNLDLSGCTLSEANVKKLASDFAQYADSGAGIGSVTFPAKYCTGATLLTPAENDSAFENGSFDAEGLSIKANYKISGTNYSSVIKYTSGDPLFTFDFDASSPGNKTMTYKYNGITFSTGNVKVVAPPKVYLLGAQIRIDSSESQTLRFVARVDKRFGEEITLGDYGFIALPSDQYKSEELAFGSVYGANEMISTGTVFRPELGSMYNGDEFFTYSGAYPAIPLSAYAKDVKAVAFVKFSYEGEDYYTYSEIATKNVLAVAEAAYGSPTESETFKSWIKTNVIDAYADYSANNSYDSASADALRQKIVDYMTEESNFEWTPGNDMTVSFNVGSSVKTYTLKAGTTYKGLPYIADKKATLDEFKEYITVVETSSGAKRNIYTGPSIDLVPGTATGTGNVTSYEETYKHDGIRGYITVNPGETLPLSELLPGTDYGSIVNAWNRVCSNYTFFTTPYTFLPEKGGRGAVKVGDYVTGTDTSTIVSSTGEEAMYEAYAKVRKGDVILTYYSSDRGLRMAMEDAHVVRGTNGKVDPSQSTVKAIFTDSTLASNSFYRTATYTFADLYAKKRIPVTFPEISSGLDTQTVTTLQHFDGENAIATGKLSGEVYSDHSIISVNVSLVRKLDENDSGKDVALYDKTYYYNSRDDMNVNRVSLTDFPDVTNAVRNCVEGKTYYLTVKSNVMSEGEKVLVEYEYVKPMNDVSKYETLFTFGEIADNTQRDVVVQYMYDMSQYEWTPTVNFSYVRNPASTFTPSGYYKAGQTYRGVAYTNTRSTAFEFDEILGTAPGRKTFDPLQFVPFEEGYYENKSDSNFINGRKSYMTQAPDGLTKTVVNTENGAPVYYIDWNRILGNHCASSLTNALQQAVRVDGDNLKYNVNGLDIMLPHDDYMFTGSIAHLYGPNAMYEHYALVRKGDVCYTRKAAGGHNRCAYEDAFVIRDANGIIDPDRSYIKMIEQTDTLESAKDSTFVSTHGYDTSWWVGHDYTFTFLYDTNAAIFNTVTEFLTGESEQAYLGLTKKTTSESVLNGVYGMVESNYPLLMVRMRITDNTSGEVYEQKFMQHPLNTNSTLYKYYKYNITTLYNNIGIADLPSGSYTYTLEAEIGQGIRTLDTCTFTK